MVVSAHEGEPPPGAALRRGQHLEGENVEFWNLADSGKLLFALQTVIFLHPLVASGFATTPPTVIASRLHRKHVYTKKLTLLTGLIIHLL